jgi:hypothetical protein
MITLGQVAGGGVGGVTRVGDGRMGEEGMDCVSHSSGVAGCDGGRGSGSQDRGVDKGTSRQVAGSGVGRVAVVTVVLAGMGIDSLVEAVRACVATFAGCVSLLS